MYFRNIRTLNAAFKETGDMHMSQKIYGKSEICYPGVEVKALCPSWADTEIVSGVKEEIKVNLPLVLAVTIFSRALSTTWCPRREA